VEKDEHDLSWHGRTTAGVAAAGVALSLLIVVTLNSFPAPGGAGIITASRAVLSYSLEIPNEEIIQEASTICPQSFLAAANQCRLSGAVPYYDPPFDQVLLVVERISDAYLRVSIGAPEPYDWFPGGALVWSGTAESLARGLMFELWLRPKSQHRRIPNAANGATSGVLKVRLDVQP
jgi:hypothetical protein